MPLTKLRKTPGVYVEEIPLFPPSVAPVETAIPAFIGYTEKANIRDENLTDKPTRISSMLEFEQAFGSARKEVMQFDVDQNSTTNVLKITAVVKPELEYRLYYAMQMFFANGGGPCWIVSVGNYNATVDFNALSDGVDAIEKIDEVTLFVIPDAVALNSAQHTSLMNSCLQQCNTLQDRFTIMDIKDAIGPRHDLNNISAFRNTISSTLNEVKYGAAYYPYLETTLNFRSPDGYVQIRNYTLDQAPIAAAAAARTAVENAVNALRAGNTTLNNAENALVEATSARKAAEAIQDALNALPNTATIDQAKTAVTNLFDGGEDAVPASVKIILDDNTETLANAIGAANTLVGDTTTTETTATVTRNTAAGAIAGLQATCDAAVDALIVLGDISFATLSKIQNTHNVIYNAIKQKIVNECRVVLPPSSTVAGVYASVDSRRGVWKAPANVSLTQVVRPMVKLTDRQQEDLNVHVNGGKSINAIRSFTGRGILIWGARTLAGNDNEWRYISVRRFFNFVEESVKKATIPFVFEPNSANTWVKVKAMIENFLIVQWRAGALVGAKPEDAFYVKIGLNETMSAEDILNGYMVVEIGMAVVRPAEFIILQFMHKMQES